MVKSESGTVYPKVIDYACGAGYAVAMNATGTIDVYAVWTANYAALRDTYAAYNQENEDREYSVDSYGYTGMAKDSYITGVSLTAVEEALATAGTRLTAFNETNVTTVNGYVTDLTTAHDGLELVLITEVTCNTAGMATHTHNLQEFRTAVLALFVVDNLADVRTTQANQNAFTAEAWAQYQQQGLPE